MLFKQRLTEQDGYFANVYMHKVNEKHVHA